jgi:HNH endonuclease/AP2 domain
MAMPRITQDRLKEVLSYNAETGVWAWLVSLGTARKGATAGWVSVQGYLCIGIDGRDYQAHTLAWFYMTGEWLPKRIDHRDLDKTNCRWLNLRRATASQNGANRGPNKNNKTGQKGVYWDKARGKWAAYIMVDRRSIALGRYDEKPDAMAAYAAAAAMYFGEFARAA